MMYDDPSTAANPSLLAITPVNEQLYFALLEVAEFCALSLSKLYSALRNFLKDNGILTSFILRVQPMIVHSQMP